MSRRLLSWLWRWGGLAYFSFLYWKRSLAFGWLKLMSSTFWLCWVLVHMNCKVLSTDTRPWDCWCLLIVLFYGSSARPLKCFKFIFDAEVLVLLINDCWSVRLFFIVYVEVLVFLDCYRHFWSARPFDRWWSTRLFRLLPALLKCSSCLIVDGKVFRLLILMLTFFFC